MSLEICCPDCQSVMLIDDPSTHTVQCSSCGRQFTLAGGVEEHSTLRLVAGEKLSVDPALRFAMLE